MLYSDIRLYLKTNLAKPKLNFKFSEKDNTNFFNFIKKKFPHNHVLDEDVKEDIKLAFKDYFSSVGHIIFYMENHHILLKVVPYEIEPRHSVNAEHILDIIDDNEKYIEYDYKGNENQILIQNELREAIFDFVDGIDNEVINKKELIRYAIRKALKLQETDIIVVKHTSIFIKLLSNIKRVQVSAEQVGTIAGRFNGIDEAELVSFYDEYFSHDNKNFFSLVAKLFVDKFFIEEKIDNAEYEKSVFAYIQSIIIDQLNQILDHNEDFFKGFSGYVFRIHFQEVFTYISDLILNEIFISNAYINDFLKYYSLDVIVLNGVKYKVPPLEADNGQRWNLISITSIAKVYIKVKMSIEKLEEDIVDVDEKISNMFVGSLSPIEFNDHLVNKSKKLATDIANSKKELEIYTDKYDLSKKTPREEKTKKQNGYYQDKAYKDRG